MPKDISAALKVKGIDVSPQMVSMIKAKSKIKKAQRRAKAATADDATAGAKNNRAAGLDAALTLYTRISQMSSRSSACDLRQTLKNQGDSANSCPADRGTRWVTANRAICGSVSTAC